MNNVNQNDSIVYIYIREENEKAHIGMGVLIDNTHIITCAHIFNGILINIDGSEYNKNKSNYQNKSEKDLFLKVSSEPDREFHFKIIKLDKKVDFAILEMDEVRPENSTPARLFSIKSTPCQHHNVQIFGVTKEFEGGVLTFYKIQGLLPNNRRVQIAKRTLIPGIEITRGFSGAHVWDEKLGGAIGIIAKSSRMGLAEVIPFDLIKEKYSDLILIKPASSLNDKMSNEFNILLNYLDDKSGNSLENIIKMRDKLIKLNYLRKSDLEVINNISRIVIDVWSVVRDKFFWQEENLYKYLFNFAEYDDIHCILLEEKLYETIFEENIEKLIDDNNLNENISRKDLLLLIAACWLHDIGMVPELFKDDKILKGEKDEYLIKDVFTYIFKNHHKRAARFIEEHRNELLINDLEELKKLCEFHRHKEYVPILEECKRFENEEIEADTPINVALLACYLRLAGAIQVPRKSEVKGFVPMGFEDPYSMFQWLKSQCVEKTVIKRDEHKIQIYIRVPNELVNYPDIEILKNSLQIEIQNELDFTRDIFIKYNKNFYLIADCRARPVTFDPEERKEFNELLSNIELFVPTMSPNASAVMENVLNQIKTILLSSEDSIKNINALRNYNVNVLDNIVRKRPCHVFFVKVKKFLEVQLKNIESKESLDEFRKTEEELRRKTYENTQRRILRKIEAWIGRRKKIIEKGLPSVACSILLDSSPILLYGFSSSIVSCFKYAIDKNERVKSTEIYICEAASKREYRYNNRLIYCDSIKYIEELSKLDMKNLYYIADACASNLFSKNKISKVLFGANGIDCKGNVHHTLGHLAIADMASKYNISVYVLSDSLKIGIINVDLETQRGNQWLTTDVEQELKLNRNNIHYYNPRGDKVPSNLITFIITENGISKPERIRELTEDYWIKYGKRLMKKRSFDEALRCFNKAIELYPEGECAWFYKRQALIKLNRRKDAEKIWERGSSC